MFRWFRISLAVALAVVLAACAPAPVRNPLATWVPSPNHDGRRPVLIVLHATEMDSAAGALDVLRTRNSGGRVSAHYLVARDGHIYQLVPDSERAWHAGAGRWGAITDVNSASIGIELDNNAGEAFPPAQIASLIRLLGDLTARLRIVPTQVIAHADLAPARKGDPGPLFPWAQLAQAGFGLWPRGTLVDPPPGFDPWTALTVIGYPLDDRTATVRAFHAHYRGMQTDTLDTGDLQILYALTWQLHPLVPPTLPPMPSAPSDASQCAHPHPTDKTIPCCN
jgi:N-acetylmuramoyl-L-alanine amidase